MTEDLEAFYAYPPGDRTYVRAALVQTSDGALGGADQTSHAITRPADQRALATMRRLADVILIGGNTVRQEGFGRRPPPDGMAVAALRPDMPVAVISASLRLDPESSLFTDATTRPYVFTTATAPTAGRTALAAVATVVTSEEPRVPMTLVLDTLARDGLVRVLCEAGPNVLAQLGDADLLDEVCLTTVPERSSWDAPRFVLPAGMVLAGTREEDGLRFDRYVRSTSAKS
ncbi:MAG TPA: dihydrofolate reductase family protein [Jiangellaceae bacterium]